MSKKIIFYGGCQGVGKSERLAGAMQIVNQKQNDVVFNEIKVSKFFEKFLTADSGTTPRKILWYRDDWKKYDKYVVSELCEKIKANNQINVINSHFSVLYKGKGNYVPGLELSSLEELLKQSFLDRKGKIMKNITEPCFGLLLIDPELSLIIEHYEEMYKNNQIGNDVLLNYILDETIIEDLKQNRMWADAYYDTAISVLGRDWVCRETIYFNKELKTAGFIDINTKIADFLQKFTN